MRDGWNGSDPAFRQLGITGVVAQQGTVIYTIGYYKERHSRNIAETLGERTQQAMIAAIRGDGVVYQNNSFEPIAVCELVFNENVLKSVEFAEGVQIP